jgi:hypothetical protein
LEQFVDENNDEPQASTDPMNRLVLGPSARSALGMTLVVA